MENTFSSITNKFRTSEGERSVKSFRKILDKKELDEFDKTHYSSLEEMIDQVLLNYLSSAYKKGISAGVKLSEKSGMNEVDAITFAIKQLNSVKDELKINLAEEVNQT